MNLSVNTSVITLTQPDFWLAVRRGIIGRCPNCGKARLFARYLKQVDHCPACGERYGDIRADDGPAWLTILLVGHILGAVLLMTEPGSTWPDWLAATVWAGAALLLALLILPRAKGLFIAIIWHGRLRTSL